MPRNWNAPQSAIPLSAPDYDSVVNSTGAKRPYW